MSHLIVVVLFLVFGLVSAQFDFFGNMWGHQHQQGDGQRHGQRQSGAAQWAAQVENAVCARYLCPGTLDCVESPVDCPCADIHDIKCTIPDTDTGEATVICVRGKNECKDVERLMKRWSKSK